MSLTGGRLLGTAPVSGVFYGEVQVSALNTCGQESQPAAINIPAEGMLIKPFALMNRVSYRAR